jgi:branched-chain amino acid transport system substrate-binding protein
MKNILSKLGIVLIIVSMALTACVRAAAPTSTSTPVQSAAAKTTAAPTADPSSIKIALLLGLSGAVPNLGASAKEGALLAVDAWNAKGGVLGHKISTIIEDTQCATGPASDAANKVISQDKVHYIIGDICSNTSIPMADIANAHKVILISPSSSNPAVTVDTKGKTKPYVFRACFVDPFQGKAAAKFTLTTLKDKKAYILADSSNAYVKSLADAFQTAFKAGGGKIVGRASYKSTDTDFTAVLKKVAAAKPNLVYLPDYYNVVNLVTKQAKAQGINVPFMGGDGWDSTSLDAASVAGGFYTNHYAADDTRPSIVNFIKDYGAAYKDDKGSPKVPDAVAVLSYDATNLLLEGIKKAGVDNTAKVDSALKKIKFSGVSGSITFDAQNNPIKPAVVLAVSADGVKFNSVVTP